MPRFTVVCPTYNRGADIVPTLDSVRAQTADDWELLVVSDASSDDTDAWVEATAARDARIRLLRTERHGHPSGPRNAALAEARGEIVAYLDHDDRWLPGHLATLDRLFREHGTGRDADGVQLVATGCEYRTADDATTSVTEPLSLCWHPELQLLGPLFEPSRVAHRRGVVEAVGGWRDGAGLEDWDLWLRLADAGVAFTTTTERTALLLQDTGTRRHRTARPQRQTLAEFDSARSARGVLDALGDASTEPALRAACAADMREWFAAMARDGAFVRPRGWQGPLDEAVAATVAATEELWPDLVLFRRPGRFVLAQTLWCSRPEHARRIEELSRRVHPRQYALLDELAARHTASAA